MFVMSACLVLDGIRVKFTNGRVCGNCREVAMGTQQYSGLLPIFLPEKSLA